MAGGRIHPPPPRLAIPVHYDFASTICYVAHRVLERMQPDLDALGVTLDWRPVDLVDLSGWPRGSTIEGPRRDNSLRVARELDVSVHMPTTFFDSRAAHAVAIALAGDPRAPTWRERVWSAVFEESRDIGSSGEVDRLARDLGIDLDALAGARDLTSVEQATTAARDIDVTGVPTFYVGFPLGGIQQPPTMRLLFQRWVDKTRERENAPD